MFKNTGTHQRTSPEESPAREQRPQHPWRFIGALALVGATMYTLVSPSVPVISPMVLDIEQHAAERIFDKADAPETREQLDRAISNDRKYLPAAIDDRRELLEHTTAAHDLTLPEAEPYEDAILEQTTVAGVTQQLGLFAAQFGVQTIDFPASRSEAYIRTTAIKPTDIPLRLYQTAAQDVVATLSDIPTQILSPTDTATIHIVDRLFVDVKRDGNMGTYIGLAEQRKDRSITLALREPVLEGGKDPNNNRKKLGNVAAHEIFHGERCIKDSTLLLRFSHGAFYPIPPEDSVTDYGAQHTPGEDLVETLTELTRLDQVGNTWRNANPRLQSKLAIALRALDKTTEGDLTGFVADVQAGATG